MPTPTTATLTASSHVTLISTDPPQLRTYVSAGGVEIDAFELAPGPYRVTVEYEESRKRNVEGYESRDSRRIPPEGSRLRSRCTLDFYFQANTLYRIVRSSIAEDGKLKRFNTDNLGVWLVAKEWDQPLAQCL